MIRYSGAAIVIETTHEPAYGYDWPDRVFYYVRHRLSGDTEPVPVPKQGTKI